MYALQYALGCDHYWIRIGPYLKCTRCGELRAAHQKDTHQ